MQTFCLAFGNYWAIGAERVKFGA